MGFVTSLFGIGDEQARGEALDTQLAELNTRDYSPGGRIFDRVWSAAYDAAIAAGVSEEEADAYAWNIAEGRFDTVAAHLKASKTGNLDLQLAGAAASGPLQWFYDPAAAWKDTKTGAGIAAESVGKGIGSVADLLRDALLKLLKEIPLWVWVVIGLGLFLYFGGGTWLKKKVT